MSFQKNFFYMTELFLQQKQTKNGKIQIKNIFKSKKNLIKKKINWEKKIENNIKNIKKK